MLQLEQVRFPVRPGQGLADLRFATQAPPLNILTTLPDALFGYRVAVAVLPKSPAPLDRLLDATVTDELGRVTLPISAVLNLNVNSVLELNRSVAQSVDLMVQGVPLAGGEVVVVNDCFAIRTKELMEPKKR